MTAHFHEPLFAMLQALTPPEKILPSEWIERELILPRESTARAGRVALFTLQKGMVNAAAESGVREIVFMTSAQLGKTLALNGVLGWAMATDGGPLMIVRPDEADASSYVRENLDPLIAATPALRKIIGDGAGFDNKGFKSFRGGSLALASSYKASALAGRSIRVLLADEIDRFAPVVSTGEGEPVTLAKRRLHTYRNSLCILSSTPTFAATSRIAKHYERGDKRLFHVTCQECGALAPVSQDRLRFEKGEPSTARLICLDCGHSADEAERLDMVRKGEWIATATGENGVVSFHASELASELSSLEKIAAQVDRNVSTTMRQPVC
jgi:phage terminase large subunit GpA-like protein